MKVCFDYQIFWQQKFGGISRYFCELAAALSEHPDCEPVIAAPFHGNIHLKTIEDKKYVRTLPYAVKKMLYNRFWDHKIAGNRQMALRELRRKGSILHETYYTQRFSVKKAPRVTTVHDMIYELYNNGLPEEKEIIALKKRAILEADAIIAVSENTKKDLLNFYPEVKNNIHVVYHGVRAPQVEQSTFSDSKRPFILFVGNRGWYKNFDELLQVYTETKEIFSGYDLLCFGGEKQTDPEAQLINKAGLGKNIHFVKGDDVRLWTLYRDASVLVYNSRYEGFGMPVLEAMSAGCPVIASASSSLPEVCGEAALLVQPGNKQQLATAIQKVLSDKIFVQHLIDAGKSRASAFTWQKCAENTFKVYKALAP